MLKKNKIVAYVAGDGKILIPAIVTLASVKKHNPEIDTYLFIEFDQITLNKEIAKIIESLKIRLIDIKNLRNKPNFDISSFSNFGRWPIHVFYNYSIPNYLRELGYEHAIKLDYDILCIGKYNLKELIPEDNEIISICLRGRLVDFIDKENETKISKAIKLKNFKTVNAGVIFINLASYVEKRFFEEFKRIYLFLQGVTIKEYVEQFAVGALQAEFGHEFKNLPLKYNYRPSYKTPEAIINIHYNILEKPWLKYKTKKLSSECFKSLLLNNLWVQTALDIGLNSFIQKNLYSAFDFCNSYDDIDLRTSNLLFLHKYALAILESNIFKSSDVIHEIRGSDCLTFSLKGTNSVKYRIAFYGEELFRVKVLLLVENDSDYKKLLEVYKYFNNIESDLHEFSFYVRIRHKQEISAIVSAFREIFKLSNMII